MENLSRETIMEEKEEVMVPFNGGIPTPRTAHFLKPTASTLTEKSPNPPHVSTNTISELNQGKLKVDFKGRIWPHDKWRKWFDALKPEYGHIWKQAGIFEAISASTYKILRDNGLVIKLAETWSEVTNTFVFPWGETIITLEDIMVLGGYSVLGKSVLISAKRRDLIRKQESLNRAHRDIRLKNNVNRTFDNDWIDHFMGSKDPLEHEAFLCLWLSRHVFHLQTSVVRKHIFPLAVHLSVGIQIALAPAVLASIYRDLTLLKNSIVVADKSDIKLWAPLQLVQLWAWERFPSLGPIPNTLKCEEPRAARWDSLKRLKLDDVRKSLGSSRETFKWRPYTTVLKNWDSNKFYWEHEECVVNVDKKTEAFVQCLICSELVGMDCVEHYRPHRVAMQFGFDQGVPGNVVRSNQSPTIAWKTYTRPIAYSGLYLPPRLLESDVTTRYVEWWNQNQISTRGVLANQENLDDGDILISPSVVSGVDRMEIEDQIEGMIEASSDEDDELTIAELMKRKKMHLIVENNVVSDKMTFSGPESSSCSAVLERCAKLRKPSSLIEPVDVNADIIRECENVAQVEENDSGKIIIMQGEDLVQEENEQMNKAKLEEQNLRLAATQVPAIELEARVENLERILALIKSGKLICGGEKKW